MGTPPGIPKRALALATASPRATRSPAAMVTIRLLLPSLNASFHFLSLSSNAMNNTIVQACSRVRSGRVVRFAMIYLLLTCMRYDDCTAQASTRPFIVSVKRQHLSPPQLLTFFPVVFCSAHSTPAWLSPTQPCFHCRGVGSYAPHQSPIRIKAF